MKKGLIRTFVKLLVAALLVNMAAFPALAVEIPGYEGGIKSEVEYAEILFITGEPVLLKGKVTVSQGRMKDGKRQDRISYSLYSDDRTVSLSRSITLEIRVQEMRDKRQVTTTAEIVRSSETVSVKKDRASQERYTLKNYNLSASTVTDVTPAVDYYTLVMRGRKIYDVNGGQGTVTVEMTGSGVGYDHSWGATETRRQLFLISAERRADAKKGTEAYEWTGRVEAEVSCSRTREISYVANEPRLISFKGGYMEVVKEESVAGYYYDLPRFDKNGMPGSGRNRGTEKISLALTPVNRMASIPKVLDLTGHWAQADAEKLLALGIIKGDGNYFWPGIAEKGSPLR
ncbi:hypothetical protein [Thermosediminibacter litoriperuensis]|uniref:Uncharacterized protein n=1 Tax=Thermosediminibacter litoriperuensis TaxID=291989 RepID=A0A5S5AYN4_9FIRM|nr:hypothetical protein [Thermosediminibacter litoriperuensis]TYP57474.1 hypothetical protein LZ11_00789 [Thermosediminibacter litoriperuensis]